jgi:hypothetical protein
MGLTARLARRLGFDRRRGPDPVVAYPADFTASEIAVWELVKPYTMTSPERIVSLVRAVEHVERHSIEGDIVECGVWRGGSMMAVAVTLLGLGRPSRVLRLFDTFEGMPPPTERDYTRKYGKSAREIMDAEDPATGLTWAVASLETVQQQLRSTGYPERLVVYSVGRVEDTIPRDAPERIAILRLDTDWYESTRHELVHLYPRLTPGGILIIDDYGHWEGARRAVDEYLADSGSTLFLSRIDYTARIAVKP